MRIRKNELRITFKSKMFRAVLGLVSIILLLALSSVDTSSIPNGVIELDTIYADACDPASVDYNPDACKPDLKINLWGTTLTRVSGNKILATLQIVNVRDFAAKFPKNSAVIRCDNGSSYTAQQSGATIPGSSNQNSFLNVNVEFSSGSLGVDFMVNDSGLNSIPCTIDPANVVDEEIEDNNDFNVRLFHPNWYPDPAFTSLSIEPQPVPTWFGDVNPFKITAKGKNFGADMTRSATVRIYFDGQCWIAGSIEKEPRIDNQGNPVTDASGDKFLVKRGESFTFEYDLDRLSFNKLPKDIEVWLVDGWSSQATSGPANEDQKYIGVFRKDGGWAKYLQVGDEYSGWDLTESPLELGSEGPPFLDSGFRCRKAPASYNGNNLIRGEIITMKAEPYTIYPDNGKVFHFGKFPDFQDDWYTCKNCAPSPPPPGYETPYDWKLDWVDNSLIRFRWMPWSTSNESPTRIQINDSNGNTVHDIELSSALLSASGGSTKTGYTSTEFSLHDQQFTNYWINVRGMGAIPNNGRNFTQYIGPKLDPGTYSWRVQFGDKSTSKDIAPWSSFQSFKVATNNLAKSDFFGTVIEVENDASAVKIPGILSPFIDTVEAGTSSPKIVTLLTSEGDTVKILANQSTQISNPFNSSEVQEIEKDWKIIVSANQPPTTGGYIPRSYMATLNEITVIPDKPLASHKRCTVVEQTRDNKTSLACDDGEQIVIDQAGLDAGSNAVILVHPEKPSKVISTAKSLMSRMDRFRASMQGQENANLAAFDKIKNDVDKGFYSSKERAISKAPDEVKVLMQELTDINQRIVDMAAAFTGGDSNITISASSMTDLANMLKGLAANPDFALDVMIDGSEDDVPPEKKQELKTLIREASGDHFTNLQTGILEVVSLLEAGDLENALTKLETLTANDEAWERNIVLPIMQDFYGALGAEYDAEYAQQAENLAGDVAAEIAMVKEFLEGDTSWMDSATKSQFESALTSLEEAYTTNDAEIMFDALMIMVELMQSLPSENETSQGEEAGEGTSVSDILDALNEEITRAESMLSEYEDSIDAKDRQNILDLISSLKQLDSTNDRDTIYNGLMNLVNALNAAIPYEEGYEQGSGTAALTSVSIECPPMFVVGGNLGCSFKTDGMYDSHEWTGTFSTDGSQIKSSETTFAASYQQTGTVSLEVSVCNSAGCVKGNHTIEIVEPKEGTAGAHEGGGDGQPSSGDHQGESTQASLSIEIQCAPTFSVGSNIECSFKSYGMVESQEWTATFSGDGSQIKSNESFFKASYPQTGTVSLSLSACGNSVCADDTYSIAIVEESGEHEGSGQGGGSQGGAPATLSVEIECAPTFEVGQNVECSFRGDGMVETIDWTATFSADGSQINSSEPFFKASYAQSGTVSLNLSACGNSICANDTYSIAIIEPQPSNEGDDSGEAQVEGDDSGEAQVEGGDSGEAQVEGGDSGEAQVEGGDSGEAQVEGD